MKIDLEQIRDLLKAVSQTDITELTIESGDEKITVRKSQTSGAVQTVHSLSQSEVAAAVPQPAPRVAVAVQAEQPKVSNNGPQEAPEANKFVAITSPMVGTFYRSANPTAAAFVEVGDRVNVGQTVCIIEAMKLMNDLPSEISGKVVKVLVENGTTVEFGQQLFLVDPNG